MRTPPLPPPLLLPPPCREGDLVTVSHRNDIQRAMQESVEAASRSARAGQAFGQNLPPIRLQVVKVASEVSERASKREGSSWLRLARGGGKTGKSGGDAGRREAEKAGEACAHPGSTGPGG